MSSSSLGSLAAVPLPQLQALVLYAHAHLPHSVAVFVRFDRGPSVDSRRAWLRLLVPAVSDARQTKGDRALHLAFTISGLRALGLPVEAEETFLSEFREGMMERSQVLGDFGESEPGKWEFGNHERPVDAVVLLYGRHRSAVDVERERMEERLHGVGWVAAMVRMQLDHSRREPFGFRDGISQPLLRGSPDMAGPLERPVAVGEFVLGHCNEYGEPPFRPTVTDFPDFGENGTYLVVRKLEQDIARFRADVSATAQRLGRHSDWVAERMVGRTRSGHPLVQRSPCAGLNDFGYAQDPRGALCPIGSHVRRANPRDSLPVGTDESLRLANRHRIIRRGRPYVAVEKTADADEEPTGLLFMAVNANIGRQFEFIQQSWLNNPKFAGLDESRDPITGDAGSVLLSPEPDRCEALGLGRFVTVRGGGYFFMPSIPALRYLARLPRITPAPPASHSLEMKPAEEDSATNRLCELLRGQLERLYGGGFMLRAAHPKCHGVVRARFHVRALSNPWNVGLFSREQEYDALIRFSNQNTKVDDDRTRDIRGVAIKVLNVAGPKLSSTDWDQEDTAHDFLLITTQRFVARDVDEFARLIAALFEGRFPRFLITHPAVALRIATTFTVVPSVLTASYCSATPYAWGPDRAVRYWLRPRCAEPRTSPPRDPNFLADDLRTRLAAGQEIVLDFRVQARIDEPVEDPTIAWRSEAQTVATIRIPPQRLDVEALGEDLAFDPWRCLEDHRPLGGINRARRAVYSALGGYRRRHNGII